LERTGLKTKTNKMKRHFLTAFAGAIVVMGANAQFAPGKLAVLQEGDGGFARGTTSPSDFANKQNPVFIDEFDGGTFNSNGPSFQVAIPTNGADALWVNGNAGTEGNLTRAADRSVLVFSGYSGDILSLSPGTAPSSLAYDRGISVIDATGNSFLAYRGGAWYGISTGKTNPRGVATDGTNQFWGCGNGYGSIYYNANSGADPIQFQNIALTSAVKIRNNALYTTVKGSESVNLYPAGIYSFVDFYNNPVPYPNAASYLQLVVPAAAPYTNCIGFDIDPSGTVAYMADTSFGIQKYVKAGGSWSLACNFYIPGYYDATNFQRFQTNETSGAVQVGCFSVAVDWSGAHPVLYATTSDSGWNSNNPYYGNRVIRLEDTSSVTGGGTITNPVMTVAIAPVTNLVYKSVDFTPDLRPLITANPANWSAAAGGSVTFTVGAQSTTATTYQWLQNGTNLSDQTSSTLALSSVDLGLNDATYQCIISNSYGAVTTAPPAVLTVTALPVAPSLGAAQNVTDLAGDNMTFPANAAGTEPKTYQWYLNGNLLADTNEFSGTGTSSLHITGAQKPADEGDYSVVVNNITGMPASNRVATLALVYPKPVFSLEPGSTTTILGADITLNSAGYGNSPGYQWYVGNKSATSLTMLSDASGKYTGSGTSALTINNAAFTDQTNYFVVLTDLGGSVTSSPAALAVVSVPPHSAVAYGTAGQVYAQNFDSVPIPNAVIYNAANPQPMTVVTNLSTGKTASYTYSLANPFDFAYPIIPSGFVGGLGLAGKMDGWYGWAGTLTKLGASVGDQSTGGLISEGGAYTGAVTAGSSVTNRALGLLATSTTGPTAFGVKFLNQTGRTLSSINLSYTGELWRQQARTQTLAFGYTVDVSATNLLSTNVTAWVQSLDVGFPASPGGLEILDGTQSSNQVSLAVTSLAITNWPPDAALWLVWVASDSQGGAQGIAIDDLRFSAGTTAASLSIQSSGGNVIVSWPQSAGGYALESSGSLVQPGGWLPVDQAVVPTNGWKHGYDAGHQRRAVFPLAAVSAQGLPGHFIGLDKESRGRVARGGTAGGVSHTNVTRTPHAGHLDEFRLPVRKCGYVAAICLKRRIRSDNKTRPCVARLCGQGFVHAAIRAGSGGTEGKASDYGQPCRVGRGKSDRGSRQARLRPGVGGSGG
jgi:hypothetical protein